MKKILVVDDDAMNLRVAEFILGKAEAYEILKASSGEECLEVLEKESIDLVLLDVEMPGMNGIKTLEIIREKQETANLAAMFLSADEAVTTKEAAERLGALAFIKKPFMPQDLLDNVAKVFAE
ncbi:MAG: response regulator [Lachnospiraceae bacterium]|nr:response regulator [Lachnospiraceae bacterium]